MRIVHFILPWAVLLSAGRARAQTGDEASDQKFWDLEHSATFLERTTEAEYQGLAGDVLQTLKPSDRRHAMLASAALESVYATLAIFEFAAARDSNSGADPAKTDPPVIKTFRHFGEQLVSVSKFNEATWWTALHEALGEGSAPNEMRTPLTLSADPKCKSAHEDLERTDKALYSMDLSDSDRFDMHLARAQDYVQLATAARQATIASLKGAAERLRTPSEREKSGGAAGDVRRALERQYRELARLELEDALSLDPANAEALKEFDALKPRASERKKANEEARGLDDATASRLAELNASLPDDLSAPDAALKAARVYEAMASALR